MMIIIIIIIIKCAIQWIMDTQYEEKAIHAFMCAYVRAGENARLYSDMCV